MRAFINNQNPWFTQFSKEDIKNMGEDELRGYVDSLKVLTLGVDVLSTEEINLRVEQFIAKHRADGAKQWADQQLIEVGEQAKLDDTLELFDEHALRGTLSTCKHCGEEIIYKESDERTIYYWYHTASDETTCSTEDGGYELAEPVGGVVESDEEVPDVKLETSTCQHCGKFIYRPEFEDMWRHCPDEGVHMPTCFIGGPVAEPREDQ
jgi:predicted RNA-binding Zn-ribbon protein involved in translation (DUF1610 family)